METLNLAIKLEMAISKLYLKFSESLKDDRSFWLQMQYEESNHAALLKTVKDLNNMRQINKKFVLSSPEYYEKTIKEVLDYAENGNCNDRNAMFSFAFELEQSAAETHYQQVMDNADPDEFTRVFIKLNRMDRDHAERVKTQWERGHLKILK